MKHKNILLLFIALVAFASCSKEEETQGEGPGDPAQLSIKVRATGGNATRAADEYELAGEAALNNLTAIVFNETGTQLISHKWQATPGAEGTTEITDVAIKTGPVQIAIVANAAQGAFDGVNNYTDFEARVVQLSTQKQSALTMSSQLITATVERADDNYIGYSGQTNVGNLNTPVLLTRLAARIDVATIRTNFAGSHLEDRAVRVNSIWVNKAKTASRYFSPADWGVVEVSGNLADEVAKSTIDGLVHSDASLTGTPYRAYVMENGATEGTTNLVIDATLLANSVYKAERRLFSVVVNEKGKTSGYNHNYIKRNFVYELGITFGKNSFKGDEERPDPPAPDPVPDPSASLEVTVVVANWGIVYQEPVIE